MVTRETYLTPQAQTRLEEELDHLRRNKRPEVADRIQRSKEVGGTLDNAEYDDAKNDQSFNEGRIQELERKLNHAILIPDHTESSGVVQLGSRVVVQNEQKAFQEYTIVGVDDADPPTGKISHESPVGKALLHKKANSKVEIGTPRGKMTLRIVEVS
jgi:transcription elongation factor GreA